MGLFNGIIQNPHDHLFKNSEASGFNLSALTRTHTKIDKFTVYFFMIVTKYVTRQVLWVNLFTLYVIHHIGIPHKPHDQLFQKSGHLGLTGCITRKQTKIYKIEFFSFNDYNQIPYRLLRVHLITLCEIHHNGIIEAS